MDTKLKIEKQKDVAKEVFNSLTKMCYGAILAGGAPRDWHFGEPANDLDFYFVNSSSYSGVTRKQLILCGIDDSVRQLGEPERGEYKTIEGLRRIFQLDVDGIKVQLMQLESEKYLYNIVKGFSVSICEAWCKSDMEIRLSENFILSEEAGCMFLGDGYSWDDPHPTKILERFRGKFSPTTKEKAERQIINNVIRKARREGRV